MAMRDFDNLVRGRLQRLARRLRVCRAVEGVGVAAVVLFAALAIQLLLDWSLRLRWDMRAALLAVIVALGAWTVWRHIVRPLRLKFGVREMASAVEARFPQLDALLVSAVAFDAHHIGPAATNSPDLARAVVAQAADAAENIAFDDVINGARAKRAVGKTLAVLAAIVLAFTLAPETLGIWLDRNLLLRDVAWPKRTRLIAEVPGDGIVRGALGDDLDIRARVADGYTVPRQVELLYETREGKTGRETMTGVGESGFRILFPRVREEFRFRIVGGDDATDWFDTKFSERPRVASATLTVTPPAYTRQRAVTLPHDQRAAEMYAGGTLTIHAVCSKPIIWARLHNETEPLAPVTPEGATLTVSVRPLESTTYHFDLEDEDGLHNTRPVRFSVRLIEDESPTVRLNIPNVGNMVTQQAVLPVEVEFADAEGLAEAVLNYQITGAEAQPREIPLDGFTPYDTRFSPRHPWPIVATGAEVGAQITVFAQARDFNDITGPGVGESTTITFRVVNNEELLAEFSRREQEFRRQFERAVDSQERLRRELLTLLARMNDAAVLNDLDLRLAPLERRQRQIIAQVNVIRQQFEQVLTEMGINRLDALEVRERLGDGVIAPLSVLGTRELSEAADQLRRLGRERTVELGQTVDPSQARIAAQMRLVLDNMLKWEGYQENVAMLREILRLQEELNAETREEVERQGRDIFDD